MKESTKSDGFLEAYASFKLQELDSRFLSYPQLEQILEKISVHLKVEQIGSSFLEVPIHSLEVGKGSIKILAWSQMHGNESTSTRGLLDLVNFFVEHPDDPETADVLSSCTIKLIPMLNPDGAARYTRENVNGLDLNRDAQRLQEKESRLLRRIFDDFQPDYCLNLHDQRTIFSAGNTPKPATLSFLAPAMDEARNISESRKVAMQIIAGVNAELQKLIPGQVGRYDDAFNLNCVGDTFQNLKIPTILFEAGHFPKDYKRETTRKYFSLALYHTLLLISRGGFSDHEVAEYHAIPENEKNFFDIILRNGRIKGQSVDIALQYEERLKSGDIHLEPRLKTMAPHLSYFGHYEIDCGGGVVEPVGGGEFGENDLVQAILLNNEKLSIESQDIP